MSLSPDYKTDFASGRIVRSTEINKNFQLIEQGNSFDPTAIRNDSIDDATITFIKLNEDVTSFFENADGKGQPDGYCPLDASGIIPGDYIPETTIVDIYNTDIRPRLTTAERDLLTPEEGDEIYNIDNHRPEYFDGINWI